MREDLKIILTITGGLFGRTARSNRRYSVKFAFQINSEYVY